MKATIFALSLIFCTICVVYGALAILRRGRLGRMLACTSFCCALTMASLAVFAISGSVYVKEFAYCAEFVFTDWTLFSLLAFVCEYIERPLKRREAAVVATLFHIDSAICISNPINHYAAVFSTHEIGNMVYLDVERKIFWNIHYLYIYFLCAYMLGAIIFKIFKTPKLYKGRYALICAILSSILIFDVYFALDPNNRFDITAFLIAVAVAVLYHSTYTFLPKRLLEGLQAYVNDNISDATIIYDDAGEVLSINKKAKALIETEIWKNSENLLNYLGFPDTEGNFRKQIKDNIFDIFYKPIYDEKDKILAKTFIFTDITRLEHQIEREHRIATMDPLTGAYNRNGFFEAANDFLYINESDAGFALIVSGIVNFKAINSSYGTAVGDRVLKYIAGRFKDYNHNYPLIYGRTAEGKFSILLPFDYVDEIAADMSSLEIPVDDGPDIHVDMCHGFVVLDDIAKPLEHYYERALLALAECKDNPLVGIMEYSYSFEDKVKRKQAITAEMHRALREDQFYIDIQPQINLSDRTVSGAEALVRWKHPLLGRLMPNEFIPIFEENGFIVNLDIHVWEMAAALAKNLSDRGIYYGPISINVSQIDISKTDVVNTLLRIVEKNELDPYRLHIEITESACTDRRDLLIRTMENLRKNGFILEIDDFGSGYSSLNALMHMPFDIVKLDLEFMKEKNLDGRNGVIIQSIVEKIHAMHAEVIVEGVEDEVNVENMVRFGGDVAQGYYFSRPLSPEAFSDFVRIHGKR